MPGEKGLAKMNVELDRKDNFGHLAQDKRDLCTVLMVKSPLGISATLLGAAHVFHELFPIFTLLN